MQRRRTALLELYDILPFGEHPLWRAIRAKELSPEQVIRAEIQHWLRTRAGQPLRLNALNLAKKVSPPIFEALLETYLEECTSDATGPSHLELIERLLVMGGVAKDELIRATSTPGNAAAIALYKDIGVRGAGCHMLGAGTVEHFDCQLSA